ncbi:unnamed protein product [Schistosoma mattheei]|uniref:Uncharacterized protein n=1 Tax=Schistosoma mattheei TaxID=31246 RepID=A0A183NEJ7_9TREM|nr:unnamed protein product [Schistosoma mattheei]
MAIRKIKSGKEKGPSNISAEALMLDTKATASMLNVLFMKTREEEQVPMDWKEEYLIKIPKKGDPSKCENYRSIELLSIRGKVFNRMLLNRMRDSIEAQIRDQQAGFVMIRRGRTESRQYRSSLNNHLSGTRHDSPSSLTIGKRLTVWIGEHYGNFFGIMVYLIKLSTSSGIRKTDYSANSCIPNNLEFADDMDPSIPYTSTNAGQNKHCSRCVCSSRLQHTQWCMLNLKLGELLQPSSRRCKYL